MEFTKENIKLICADNMKIMAQYPDNYFDYVYCDNVLEHLDDVDRVLKELWRISKPNTKIRIIVPYWNAVSAYNDSTHKHWFNERTFEILCGIDHSYSHSVNRTFNLKIKLIPNKAFKFLPQYLLRLVGHYICNVISALDVELEVINKEDDRNS